MLTKQIEKVNVVAFRAETASGRDAVKESSMRAELLEMEGRLSRKSGNASKAMESFAKAAKLYELSANEFDTMIMYMEAGDFGNARRMASPNVMKQLGAFLNMLRTPPNSEEEKHAVDSILQVFSIDEIRLSMLRKPAQTENAEAIA